MLIAYVGDSYRSSSELLFSCRNNINVMWFFSAGAWNERSFLSFVDIASCTSLTLARISSEGILMDTKVSYVRWTSFWAISSWSESTPQKGNVLVIYVLSWFMSSLARQPSASYSIQKGAWHETNSWAEHIDSATPHYLCACSLLEQAAVCNHNE